MRVSLRYVGAVKGREGKAVCNLEVCQQVEGSTALICAPAEGVLFPIREWACPSVVFVFFVLFVQRM